MEGATYKLYAQQGDILHTLQCCLCDHFCSNTNKGVISHFLRKFIITSELVKSFEVDSSRMPLSSQVKSSQMWPSRRRSTWGRFQPQVGSCFCTAATRRSTHRQFPIDGRLEPSLYL